LIWENALSERPKGASRSGASRRAYLFSDRSTKADCTPETTMASSSGVHFLYILRCADGTLYIGETADLERRLHK
jgi:hypothetical protein